MLHELAAPNHALELVHRHEVVIDVARLAGARRARRVRDRGGEEGGVLREEARVEGSLSDARGTADDDGVGGWGDGCVGFSFCVLRSAFCVWQFHLLISRLRMCDLERRLAKGGKGGGTYETWCCGEKRNNATRNSRGRAMENFWRDGK